MEILHISAECYPAAKAGGLGDVVGALPKYLTASGTSAGVVMPKYDLKFMKNNEFEIVHHGSVRIHNQHFPFTIEKTINDTLGYHLYMVNIPGKFDRPVFMQTHIPADSEIVYLAGFVFSRLSYNGWLAFLLT